MRPCTVRDRDQRRRLRVGLLVAALIALVFVMPSAGSRVFGASPASARSSAGSPQAAEQKWYFRVTAHRLIHYHVIRHGRPYNYYKGSHQFVAAWELRGIGVATRYGIRLLDRGAIVRGIASTYDDVVYLDPVGPPEPICARAAAANNHYIEQHIDKGSGKEPIGRFALAQGADVFISGSGPYSLNVKPGKVPFGEHCSETENLLAHGIGDSPSFSFPAPEAKRFMRRAPFNRYCADDYTHTDLGHTFSGVSKSRVTIAPFPATEKALKANRKALRDTIGKEPDRVEFSHDDISADPDAPDCG